MKHFVAFFLFSVFATAVSGFIVGCHLAYKPDVDIERATIQSDKSIHGSVRGEYNAK